MRKKTWKKAASYTLIFFILVSFVNGFSLNANASPVIGVVNVISQTSTTTNHFRPKISSAVSKIDGNDISVPYNVGWKAGDTHVHSTYTDGTFLASGEWLPDSRGSYTLEELVGFYKSHLGYSWFASTDHNFCFSDANEYYNDYLKKVAETNAANPGFAIINGEEMNELEDYTGNAYNADGTKGTMKDIAHINIFNSSDYHSSDCSDALHNVTNPADNTGNLLKEIQDERVTWHRPVMAIFNHPDEGQPLEGWSSYDAVAKETLLKDKYYNGIEIVNGSKVGQNENNHHAAALWRDVLLAGKKVMPYAGSDTENVSHIGSCATVAFTNTSNVTPDNITEALVKGREYVTVPEVYHYSDYGPGIAIWAKGDAWGSDYAWMGSSNELVQTDGGYTTVRATYSYDCPMRITFYYSEGNEEKSVYKDVEAGSGELEVLLPLHMLGYVRATAVKLNRADPTSAEAYTAPIWVDRIVSSTFATNYTMFWAEAVSGSWHDVEGGREVSSPGSGNGILLNSATGVNSTYEADIRLTTNNPTAGSLVFRSNDDASKCYMANVSTEGGGTVKLFKIPYSVIGTYQTPITSNITYHLKVVTEGSHIQVYLDYGTVPLIDKYDSSYYGGRFGLCSWNGTVVYQNVNKGFVTNLPNWYSVSGKWSNAWLRENGGKKGYADANANSIILSTDTDQNITYSADIRLETDNPTAGSLVFRSNSDATQCYVANISTENGGQVKLFKFPYSVIGTYKTPTPIYKNTTYNLKVVAWGSNIKVYLNNGTTPVINAYDSSYSNGHLGLCSWNGTAAYQNVNKSTFISNLTGWSVVNGTWDEVVVRGIKGAGGGNNFTLASDTGTDFTYKGDIKVLTDNPTAGALVFRSNNDASQCYAVNISTENGGQVKLFKLPYTQLGVYSIPGGVHLDQFYDLQVTVSGSNIKVYTHGNSYLGGTTPVIDVNDTSYTSGRFGLLTWNGAVEFQNVVKN